jgi:hypothetical protein
MIVVFTILLISSVWLSIAEARVARGGGGSRPSVGNRSAGHVNRGNVNRGNLNRGNVDRGNLNRGNVDRGNLNRGNVDRGNLNRGNVNRNNLNGANVNRGNINRNNVNQRVNNANVNRNVNANGWGNHYWNDDPHWGWGSFAGGAAAAATGAAVGAAVANSHDDYAVAAPPAGTVVSTLPAGCSTAANTDQALYSCGGANYQPAFDGSSVVYQAVGQP